MIIFPDKLFRGKSVNENCSKKRFRALSISRNYPESRFRRLSVNRICLHYKAGYTGVCDPGYPSQV